MGWLWCEGRLSEFLPAGLGQIEDACRLDGGSLVYALLRGSVDPEELRLGALCPARYMFLFLPYILQMETEFHLCLLILLRLLR